MPSASSRASNCWGEVGSWGASAAAPGADWVAMLDMVRWLPMSANRGAEIANDAAECQPRRPAASRPEPRFHAQVLEKARNRRLANASLIAMMRAAHRRSAGVAQG